MRIEASEVYCIRLSLNLRDRIPKTSTIGGLLMNHAKIAHQTEEASSPIQADRQLPSCAAHRWQFKDLGLLPLRSATSTTPASVDTPILGVVWQLSPRPCSPRAVSPSCRWWVYFSRLRGVAVSGGLAPPPPCTFSPLRSSPPPPWRPRLCRLPPAWRRPRPPLPFAAAPSAPPELAALLPLPCCPRHCRAAGGRLLPAPRRRWRRHPPPRLRRAETPSRRPSRSQMHFPRQRRRRSLPVGTSPSPRRSVSRVWSPPSRRRRRCTRR